MWDCHQEEGKFVLFGDWTLEEIVQLREYFRSHSGIEIVFELQDVEIITGEAMADCITWLRELLLRHQRVVLHKAPQMLAHTLYKTNILQAGKIIVIDPRYDSGIGV